MKLLRLLRTALFGPRGTVVLKTVVGPTELPIMTPIVSFSLYASAPAFVPGMLSEPGGCYLTLSTPDGQIIVSVSSEEYARFNVGDGYPRARPTDTTIEAGPNRANHTNHES